MLDVTIRILAHLLTPLFLIGMAGSAVLVISKLGSDIMEFFQKDPADATPGAPLERGSSSSV